MALIAVSLSDIISLKFCACSAESKALEEALRLHDALLEDEVRACMHAVGVTCLHAHSPLL